MPTLSPLDESGEPPQPRSVSPISAGSRSNPAAFDSGQRTSSSGSSGALFLRCSNTTSCSELEWGCSDATWHQAPSAQLSPSSHLSHLSTPSFASSGLPFKGVEALLMAGKLRVPKIRSCGCCWLQAALKALLPVTAPFSLLLAMQLLTLWPGGGSPHTQHQPSDALNSTLCFQTPPTPSHHVPTCTKAWPEAWPLAAQVSSVCCLLLAALVALMAVRHLRGQRLVRAMLPQQAIRKLSRNETYTEAFSGVSVLFADIVCYTNLASELTAEELVELLHSLFSGFDDLTERHGLHKVETIGDAFMCVGGAPTACCPVAAACNTALMAQDMVRFAETFESGCKRRIQIRVGISSGDAMAAVMGRLSPRWCLVGNTVNCAARMESTSQPQQIQVTASTAALLRQNANQFQLVPRGSGLDVKGKGVMQTYWLSVECQPAVHNPWHPS